MLLDLLLLLGLVAPPRQCGSVSTWRVQASTCALFPEASTIELTTLRASAVSLEHARAAECETTRLGSCALALTAGGAASVVLVAGVET